MKPLSSEQHFTHYKSIYDKNFQYPRACYSEMKSLTWPQFKLIQNFMPTSLPASLTMIQSTKKSICLGQHFTIYIYGKNFQGHITLT